MIALYCEAHHPAADTPCAECRRLQDYALARLDRCPFGNASGRQEEVGVAVEEARLTVGQLETEFVAKQAQLDGLRARLEALRPGAVATAELFNSLPYPDFHHGAEHFSLHNDKEYVSLKGTLKSADHEFKREDYLKFVQEYHEPDMTANFVVREGHTYMVGALARVNNNFGQLSPEAQELAKAGQLMKNLDNPYYNNVSQAVELVAAVDQAIEMLGTVKPHQEPLAEIKPHACRGVGTVEVPRGTLWHEYELDDTGHVKHANIITPTAQNLRSINDDLRAMLPSVANLPRAEMADAMEKMIRSYDPYLSCAAHFLRIEEI